MRLSNLSNISDREFEALCCELLGVKLRVDVKQGRPGSDGGIDGLFAIAGQQHGVMQAKHYLKSGITSLMRQLKNVEVAKAKAINVSRYVLMTSCPLSPQNRFDIVETFDGMISSIDDVYGGEEICKLLDTPEYEFIKKRHYNLWLSDIDALQQFCGDGAQGVSESILEDIREDLQTAVKTDAFSRAKSKLMHDNVLIVTGEAGCGKTTLAEQLVADLVFSDDYRLIASTYNIDSFERQAEINPGRKILFYLDDFLGAITLSAFTDNRDTRIVKFIRRIKRSDNWKLLMTSRTYIVNDAIRHSNRFADAKVKEYAFELTKDRISRIDRAKIVHSHLYYGDVPYEYKDKIYTNENYFKIIDHRNFNPRTVHYCFDASKSNVTDNEESTVLSHVVGFLDNPATVWKDCFEGLNALQLLIVLMVFLAKSSGQTASEDAIKIAIKRALSSLQFAEFRACSIEGVLRGLCGSLLSRSIELIANKQVATFSLFNPSIGDYIISEYGENEHFLVDALLALSSPKVVLSMNSVGRWTDDHPKYNASCKAAYSIVVADLTENPNEYSPDFVLGLFGEICTWMDFDDDALERLALSCWKAGVWFLSTAEPAVVVKYLYWLFKKKLCDFRHPKLTADYLSGMLEKLNDCEDMLKLKRVYDCIDENAPLALYEKIKRRANNWAYDIATNMTYDGGETEDDVYQYVYDVIMDKLEDYDIDDEKLSPDDCIYGCDFSGYASEQDYDGSDWEDRNASMRIAKDIEDQVIRSIFRRE